MGFTSLRLGFFLAERGGRELNRRRLKELKGEKETFAPFTEGKQPPPYGALRVREVP